MEERRKIIIQTGTDPEETLATPHFDAEATLTARPVVPLSEPDAVPRQNPYAASHVPAAQPQRGSSSSWKRSTLIFIVLAAVSIGVASGLAIGLYQTRRKAPAPVATEPSAASIQQATTQTPTAAASDSQAAPPRTTHEEEKEPEAVVQPEAEVNVPASQPDKEAKARSTDVDKRDDRDDEKQSAREARRRDEERAQQATERDRAAERDRATESDRAAEREPARDERDDTRDEIRARREERRAQRREERRRQREEEGAPPLDVPRSVERAQQQINRIRDIFEGRQP